MHAQHVKIYFTSDGKNTVPCHVEHVHTDAEYTVYIASCIPSLSLAAGTLTSSMLIECRLAAIVDIRPIIAFVHCM